MIEIEMSKDIRDFSPKLIGIFDARQLVCLGIASAYGIPLTFLLLKTLEMDISLALTIVVIAMSPPIACGYVKLYGLHLDVFLLKCVLPMYIAPAKRRYKTVNRYAYLDPEKSKIVSDQKNKKPPKLTKQAAKKRKADLEKYKAAI